MPNYNKVILIGHLVRDPEILYLQTGTAIAKFAIAVNERYQSRTVETVEKVHFFEVEVFGKSAENCGQYLSKGSAVLVEGSLAQDRWENEDGKARTKVKVKAFTVQFLSPKSGSKRELEADGEVERKEDIDDDDLPF